MKTLLGFVNEVSDNREVIFPVHPRTKKLIQNIHLDFKNIKMIEPIGYLDMVHLAKNSRLVFTDSGGLQKEAYWLNVPCITLRDETEWIETINSGWNVLYKEWTGRHNAADAHASFYGNGSASECIIKATVELLKI